MKQQVDLIVCNAKVYTINTNFDVEESFAVKNGKFIDVGNTKFILENYNAKEIIDLKGKAVFPGFIDAHCHFYGLGMTLQQANLVSTKSYQEVLDVLQVFYDKNKPNFITGRGWNQNNWELKQFPNKAKLDKIFPNIPVAINRIDGHAMLANQCALDLAKITISTTINGGDILKENGKLTGILLDNAMNLVYEIMPKPSKKLLKKALIEAQEKCFSYGLTSVHDADLKQDVLELMEEMQTNNELIMRIYAMVYATDSSLDYYLNRSKIKTQSLNIGAFKIYMDGALGSKGARMKEAYLNNEGKKGIYVTSKETLFKFGKRIKDSDFQLNVHAIGDAANEVVLKTFVEKLEINKERRWRVEHAQIVDVKDLHYYKTILPSVQPTHATSDMYWVEKLIGSQRMTGAYAYKDLLDLHGVLPLGTDFPIEDVNPFKTFYAAVARKDANGFPKNGFQIKNALTRKQTIKGMTIWGAYAAFEEKQKGSIEVGKLADFIVLDQDIMTVDIDNIIDTKVLRTYLGGELVYA